MAGYCRRFIPKFADISAPLSDLTGRGLPDKLSWNKIHQEAFDNLRKSLKENTILIAPDYSKPFTLYTDASDRGVGAVLSQMDAEGRDKPVAYYSRKLLPRETR